ncbi:Hpt domain-containing protein [Paraburkholderia phymatum]|uniref:Hpt domain protein n=1 Tax=Paraburkholderia phymatum (strain DSM 17167 / CIP 108236 / LMG 21445 / STM815) TaxID=391038 RepID=B2JQA7_PARP8|nr:Hpt domain-containing protein [Paraburkholderia phymatum]ACC73448.1 Hpt domain protein [Paraburkholderia phymatum STM815]
MMVPWKRPVFGSAVEADSLQERIDVLALGDPAVAQDVTSTLINTNCATLLYMTTAWENKDWDSLGRAAHRLAGSVSMLQCTGEIGLAVRLERAALEHDTSALATLLPVVMESVARLNDRLGALLT